MISWRDEGLLLNLRRHGESAAIIDVFTAEHGRHGGLVRGGASSKMTPILQPGAQLSLEWQARLADHLGTFRVEPVRSRARLMSDRRRLAAFNAVTALILAFLPEREADPALYELTLGLVDALADQAEDWAPTYVVWELGLLSTLGFRLDLSRCADTGSEEDLVYVSPKSGRAVCRTSGAGWEDRLLPLPGFLKGQRPNEGDVANGLCLTGYFLENWALPPTSLTHLPDARNRLLRLLDH
ncbi:MAG: DNA repair protein RecO [Pseudomonadota bacterium]